MQDVLGINRQQRYGTAEEDGKEIQGDGRWSGAELTPNSRATKARASTA